MKAGGRYRLSPGWIEIEDVREIGLDGISAEKAKESGFEGLVDLLKVARHGAGRRVFYPICAALMEGAGQLV